MVVTNSLHPPDFVYFRCSGLSVLKMPAWLVISFVVVNCCQQSIAYCCLSRKCIITRKKVKLSPKQATKVQKGSRGIALLYL